MLGALQPREVASEEFDSGWDTSQMGSMNSARCSGQFTVERTDPFQRPEDSAEKMPENAQQPPK
jgi:hypothetical protein